MELIQKKIGGESSIFEQSTLPNFGGPENLKRDAVIFNKTIWTRGY